jgi:hypothetical protein
MKLFFMNSTTTAPEHEYRIKKLDEFFLLSFAVNPVEFFTLGFGSTNLSTPLPRLIVVAVLAIFSFAPNGL